MVVESIIEYALRIRELRRAGPSNLEQALAPAFQRLLESLLPHISANELVVIPEFATPGVGRPDIALKRAGQPARAFVELKAPTKPGDPARYRDPHDKRQFVRFQSLPVWAISNFSSLRVFQRDDPIASIEIVPEAALDPETTDAKAERLIRNGDLAGLITNSARNIRTASLTMPKGNMSPHSNHRRILVDLQAWRGRHVPQNRPEIYAALCCGVPIPL